MRILKTALLSTTLLLSGTFAASPNLSAADSADGSAQLVAQTMKEFNKYKKETSSVALFALTTAGVDVSGLGLTKKSTPEQIWAALIEMAKGSKAQAESLNTATTTIQTLTDEQTAAVEALAAVRAELAAVVEAKTAVDEQLVTATGRVETLEDALAAAEEAGRTADTNAHSVIEGLKGQLAAAQDDVTALAERVAALEEAKKDLESKKAVVARGSVDLLNAAGTKASLAAAAAAANPFNGSEAFHDDISDFGASPNSLGSGSPFSPNPDGSAVSHGDENDADVLAAGTVRDLSTEFATPAESLTADEIALLNGKKPEIVATPGKKAKQGTIDRYNAYLANKQAYDAVVKKAKDLGVAPIAATASN
jgi:predicted transcriptional regulator